MMKTALPFMFLGLLTGNVVAADTAKSLEQSAQATQPTATKQLAAADNVRAEHHKAMKEKAIEHRKEMKEEAKEHHQEMKEKAMEHRKEMKEEAKEHHEAMKEKAKEKALEHHQEKGAY